MGDAGPPTPPAVLAQGHSALNTLEAQDAPPLREVKVLVTGFGVGLSLPFLLSYPSSGYG